MNTGVAISSGYWKNIEVTLQNNTATLYVDGIEKSKITDCGFTLDGLGEIQRNFIGRSYDEKVSFLNGSVDNFEMKSVAMTAEELRDVYGFTGERKPVSSTAGNIVTQVGKAPILPEKIKTLYSDGLYTDGIVTWQPVDATAYAQAGSFSVSGKVEGIADPVTIIVFVVSSEAKNLALIAKPSAIIDTPADLGGVKGLNDDYDPISSRDTSHGVWHNWQGDQGGKAWVQYDWDQKVILTGMDSYYFTDGNFAPAAIEVQYRDDSGSWIPVSNAKGLGVDLNKYNYSSFDPIATTGLRMWMTPKTLGCGVIEWKAYGYTDKAVVNKKFLTAAIAHASGLKEALFAANWSVLQAALQEAIAVRVSAEATQGNVDEITLKLNNAIASLVPLGKNIAFNALASTSYCSPWETLTAVNDNIVSETSMGAGVKHYGTWGNLSSEESVTYTWSSPMNITSTELFLFNDNGGIKTPKAYKYEYMNASGEWNEISNAQGYGLELNKYNITTFNQITTTALRITLVKPVTDGEGIGIIEWKVIGEKVQQ